MKGIIQRLNDIWSDSDHEQGCQGREYTCSCGFDADTFETAKDAIVEIERLTAENNELRTGEYLVKVIEERERLRSSLVEVMSWVKNWDVPFLEDEEWSDTAAKVNAALNGGNNA